MKKKLCQKQTKRIQKIIPKRRIRSQIKCLRRCLLTSSKSSSNKVSSVIKYTNYSNKHKIIQTC
jgi:hypothetical protein